MSSRMLIFEVYFACLQIFSVSCIPIEKISIFNMDLDVEDPDFVAQNQENFIKDYSHMFPDNATGIVNAALFQTEDKKYDEEIRTGPPPNLDNNTVSIYNARKTDTSVADALARNVRILCIVMTQLDRQSYAKSVKNTWGKRCNKLIFISNTSDPDLPAIKLFRGEDDKRGRTKAAFKYVYLKHRNEADWFFKAEDDTYVIVENLRSMLSEYSPVNPIYFGLRLKSEQNQDFVYSPPGYVLSHEALHLFVAYGLFPGTRTVCDQADDVMEDIKTAACLESVGVSVMDSRDSHKRERFLPFLPEDNTFYPSNSSWFWKNAYYPPVAGQKCFSDSAISFHKVTPPEKMYVLDYLLYQLRPYGDWTKVYSQEPAK